MSGLWYACEEPERPTDGLVVWHCGAGDDCTGCRVKAEAKLREFPDDSHVQWLARRLGVLA